MYLKIPNGLIKRDKLFFQKDLIIMNEGSS